MKKLELNAKDLMKFHNESYVTYAKDSTRELRMTCRGSYEIYHNGELVREVIQPFTAVELFNSIID